MTAFSSGYLQPSAGNIFSLLTFDCQISAGKAAKLSKVAEDFYIPACRNLAPAATSISSLSDWPEVRMWIDSQNGKFGENFFIKALQNNRDLLSVAIQTGLFSKGDLSVGLEVIGSAPPEVALPILRAFLYDDCTPVREAAILGLGKLAESNKDARASLKAVSTEETHPILRTLAAELLEALD